MSRRKTDPDNPEWTKEDFAKAKRPEDVLPANILSQFKKGRGPQKTPTKVPISLRLDPKTIEAFKAGGQGWQTRMAAALDRIAPKQRRAS